MKPEKMTDEDLEHELSQALSASRAAKVRAHIAALTAERDHWEQESASHNAAATRYEADIGDMGRRCEMVERRWAEASAERDALRERVQALEAEVGAQKAWMTDARAREAQLEGVLEGARSARQDAESLLAAIRQRAGDVDALAKVGETCAIMGSLGTGWDEAVHADVVERGDVQMLRDVSHGVARYVLGEDEAGRRQAATTARHPEGTVCMSPTCAQCATRHDPTTADAFATVRAVLSGWSRVVGANSIVLDNYLSALSLLERRMGAQDRGMRKAMAEIESEDGDPWMTLKSALTDAPPVFTLEEVRNVVSDALIIHPGDERLENIEARLRRLREG